MEKFSFKLQRFADQPGGSPPSDSSGGGQPGGGSSSSSVTWSGAKTITSATTESNQAYSSTSADQNAILINTSDTVVLTNPTVTKSGGTSASDDYSFYGINSAVMCKGGGATSITGGTVTTSAAGANGVFSYGANSGTTNATGDGTTVYISDMTITTTGDGSGGIMTTYGGTTVAKNLTIKTSGGSSAPIRTDRGGGWVTVTGGSYESSGTGSPAIYSTADITVNSATLVSGASEGVCIEGTGSIALNNCTLTASNTSRNGNATFLDTIMIYQSQSGDASSGTSSFSMSGGTLNSKSGHVFHVTNTSAVISLSNVTINNSDSDGVLLSVCDDGWSGASNIATLEADSQTLKGDILVGSDSTFTLNLSDSSTFTGNISGEITNASGSSVSTSVGTVNVSLDSTSKWYLTGDTYISSISYSGTATAANIINNGYTLYVNNSVLSGTTDSDSDSNDTTSGGDSNSTIISDSSSDLTYNKAKTIVTVGSSFSGTLSDYASTVKKINAANVTNDIIIIGNDNANSIKSGSGDDSIYGGAAADKLYGNAGDDTLEGGAGSDKLYGGDGTDVFIYRDGDGKDTIYDYEEGERLVIDGKVDSIKASGSNILLYVGSGRITVKNAKSKEITWSDDNGTTTGNYAKGIVFIDDDSSNSVKAKTGIYTLDASSRTTAVKLTGNAKANTLIGGNGDDTLKGGSGADTFVYSAGNDTITDYTAKDELVFNTAINSVTVSKKNVIFNTGNGTLTVKNGKGKNITLTDADGTTTTQKYNTSSYEATEATEPWFAKSDNLAATDSTDNLTIPSSAKTYSVSGAESVSLTDFDANDLTNLTKVSYTKDGEK